MPIIISGYLAIRTDTLRAHEGHDLRVIGGTLVQVVCVTPHGDDAASVTIATEPEPRPEPLPCGCRDATDHAEGVRLQDKMRRDFRIPRSTCVGCYVGDDGPSIHSCVIHDRRYWA